MLTVICIKWGDLYGPGYVTNLHSMCKRHLPSHAFMCFTENPVPGILCPELPSPLPGWWAKIGLLQPGLLAGDVLYLDLDVVITEDLHGMVELLETDRSKLWAPDDFSYSIVNPTKRLSPEFKRLLGGEGTINSSVMMWSGDAPGKVWDEFRVGMMEEMHGDQNAISKILWPNINIIPDRWVKSFKYNNRQPGPVTVFHGQPKPTDVRDEWVRQHWR